MWTLSTTRLFVPLLLLASVPVLLHGVQARLPPLPELHSEADLKAFVDESSTGARLLFLTTESKECAVCKSQERALRATHGIEGSNFKIAKIFMSDERLKMLREVGNIDRTGSLFFESENQLSIPALIFFRDGLPRRYELDFSKLQQMVDSFQLYTEHPVYQLDTEDDWKRWNSAERAFKVTAIFKSQEDFAEFESAARVFQNDMVFAVLANETIAKREGFTSLPHIYITAPFSSRRTELDMSNGVERLKLAHRFKKFLSNSVLAFSPFWAPEIWTQRKPKPILLTFVDPTESKALLEDLYKALLLARETNKHREEYWSVVVDVKEYEVMAKSAGVNLDSLPHIQILHPSKKKHFFYRGSIGGASISEFVDKYFDHKLKPEEKSADIPEEDNMNALVQPLVFKNFVQKAMRDAKRDVVVEFWNPECVPCRSFVQAYEKIAKHYEDDKKIVFYSYNTLENDIPEAIDLDKLPVMALFQAPVEAEDEEELLELLEERDPVMFGGFGDGLHNTPQEQLIQYIETKRAFSSNGKKKPREEL